MKILDFSDFALTRTEMKKINGKFGARCKTGDCTLVVWGSNTNQWVNYYGSCSSNVGPINPENQDCYCSTTHHHGSATLKGGVQSACYA
jgi:hypothetical protein